VQITHQLFDAIDHWRSHSKFDWCNSRVKSCVTPSSPTYPPLASTPPDSPENQRDARGEDLLPSSMEAGTLARGSHEEEYTMDISITGRFQSAMDHLASYPELPPLLV